MAAFLASGVAKSTYAKLPAKGEQMTAVAAVESHPRFSRLAGSPGAAFPSLVGRCTLVISPTPSKKRRKDSGVVLKHKLPTQTEFWRFNGPEISSSFLCFFVGDFSGTDSFNEAFFCFRFAAWDSTGTSSVGSSSELDDVSVESGEGSLFRFKPEAAGDDFEVAGDI